MTGKKLVVILVSILSNVAFATFEYTSPLDDLSSDFLVTKGIITGGTWQGNRIDISDYTNLATRSPVNLMGDTIWLETPIGVSYGGTGAISLTDGGLLVGSGTSAIIALSVASNGQLPIGSTGNDPVLATLTGGDDLSVVNAAGSITLNVDDAFVQNDADDSMLGKLTITKTGAQLALEYDSSNHTTLSVNSGGDLGITPSGGDVRLAASTNLITGGTIQAEQLTSTDDMTMEGHLLTLGNVSSVADVVLDFLSSANVGRITYDQSDDEFDFGNNNITTSTTVTAGTFTDGTATITGGSFSGVNNTMSGSILLTAPAVSNIKIGGRLNTTMYYEAQNSGSNLAMQSFTKDGDPNDSLLWEFFARGTSASTSVYEKLLIGYHAAFSPPVMIFASLAGGSGVTTHPMVFYTTGNTDQLRLNTDGNILMTGTLDVEGDIATTGLTLSGLTEGSVLFVDANDVISQDNSNLFWDDPNKRLGIGTSSPAAELTIKNSADASDAFQVQNASGTRIFNSGSDASGHGEFFVRNSSGTITIRFTGSGDNYLTAGNFGIGTANPAYDLDVNGDIRAIGSVYYGGTVGNADGTAYTKPDYVFEEGYDLMSIEQVEEYLKKENHLPWITSAKQEKKENDDAIDMTRMAFETVETTENLQIQVIELNKRNKALEKRLTKLEAALKPHDDSRCEIDKSPSPLYSE